MAKLWGGRFEASPELWVDEFGASIMFDQELYQEDIEGSIAHATMLGEVGIISVEESKAIVAGLKAVLEKIESGVYQFSVENEDIHLNVETFLYEEIGALAGKLHTARSRNDQVATDLHLYTKKKAKAVITEIEALQTVLVTLAEEHVETVMPGYTHLQHAQPISFAHHLLAYFEMLERDKGRFKDTLKRADMSPLGAAALAGTTFPIQRERTQELLGFTEIYHNSLDAVSDRDFVIEFISASATLMMHLSRLAEELILWTSHEFHFATLSDTYATGSSIMPQKKNSDMAELVRGKTGRVYGHLMGMLTTMKGLPLAYNKDMQEDKEGIFDTVATILPSIKVMAGMLSTMTVHKDTMAVATEKDFSNATELADYLAAKGVPFREAHEIVGKTVLHCIQKGIYLQDISLEEYGKIHPVIGEDVYHVLQSHTAVARRNSLGGTSFENIKKEVLRAKELLK